MKRSTTTRDPTINDLVHEKLETILQEYRTEYINMIIISASQRHGELSVEQTCTEHCDQQNILLKAPVILQENWRFFSANQLREWRHFSQSQPRRSAM